MAEQCDAIAAAGCTGAETIIFADTPLDLWSREFASATAASGLTPAVVILGGLALYRPGSASWVDEALAAIAEVDAATLVTPEYRAQEPLPLFPPFAAPSPEEAEHVATALHDIAQQCARLGVVVEETDWRTRRREPTCDPNFSEQSILVQGGEAWTSRTDRYTTITNFIFLDAIITGNWNAFFSALRHITLPALAIGLTTAGFIMRMTRSSMLEVMHREYIRAARSRGLRNRSILWVHALRNAMLPVITLLGLQFGALLGGAVITELVFSWPGMGRMLLDGILRRDYAVVQGAVILVAFFYVVVNLLVDIFYHTLDPRLRGR